MVMKPIRVVINKNGSETAYIPAELTDLFEEIVRAGETDVMESEPERFDNYPNTLFEWERR